ncbi:phage tail protein [Clostridium sp. 19966]|uniref:phage tail tube protein n=1 Tax=Clostridium sp. 19966 TaxID=2768166 RepID=UPI0028DDEA21|nr:phage tail tube protein [Clostridium sp. 19966]MDT8715438.1 phage tail protein [Clostridium sp. 19966]
MSGTGLLSKGITLGYKATSGATSYTDIPDLQEIPDMGGDPEKVEVTTLADGAKRYIQGVTDYGDLEFKFLYDNSSANSGYRVMKGLAATKNIYPFMVTFPDDTTFAFSASVSVKVASAKTNEALTFSAKLTLNTDIEVTDPTAGS